MINNTVTIMGYAGQDAETKTSASGTLMSRFSLGVNRMPSKDGATNVDWIKCIAFGKNAEWVDRNVQKGTGLLIKGHIQTGSYTSQQGQKVYTTDVVVEEYSFIGKGTGSSVKNQSGSYQNNGDQDQYSAQTPAGSSQMTPASGYPNQAGSASGYGQPYPDTSANSGTGFDQQNGFNPSINQMPMNQPADANAPGEGDEDVYARLPFD